MWYTILNLKKTIGEQMSKKTNYKYIGYHNQKEVVSTFGPDKLYAQHKCE